MTRDEALELLGCSVSELAAMLGVKSQLVSMWKRTGMPLARQYQIKDLLDGKKPLGIEPHHTPESIAKPSQDDNVIDDDLF